MDAIRRARGKHLVGIVGPRGVGKTVMLQQLAARGKGAFYLSADTLDGADLFDVLGRLRSAYEVETFLIDEVHFSPGYASALKRVFDFLRVRVVFTSSVSLSLLDAAEDLSRRVRLHRLMPFSFREYLAFTREEELSRLDLEDIVERRWTREHLLAAPHFDRYLRGGLMPFALEEPDVLPLLSNIRSRILHRDIPAVARLTTDEPGAIERLLRFVGRSAVDGISYSSLSKNLGITKYKAMAYVDLLERAFVLHRILPAGTNVLREPKVLMRVPWRLLYREWKDAIGGLREDAAVEMLRSAEIDCEYLKSTRGAKTPDFLVRSSEGDLVVEVGGKGRGRSQFKGVTVDRKLVFVHGERNDGMFRPLHLLGFL
ncbi:MAG: AAA family ATPase [Planctomycetota bacterium]